MAETARSLPLDDPLVLDVHRSPAVLVPDGMLYLKGRPSCPPAGFERHDAREYDAALRWLMASDAAVTSRLTAALSEMKKRQLYRHLGHARWLTYVRTFVTMTPRWVQYELRRQRELSSFPKLASAYALGEMTRSHVRVALSRVTPETEDLWLARCRRMSVRQLETVVREERLKERSAEQESPEALSGRRKRLPAPAGVAVLVSEAREVARKVSGYHIRDGQTMEMMAAELMSGLPIRPGAPLAEAGEGIAHVKKAARRASALGDHEDLHRELGPAWETIHKQMEMVTRLWSDLPKNLPEVILMGAPYSSADPHTRVRFWSGVRGRLDAVRGRLLRVVEDRQVFWKLRFSGVGQYVRERMGLSYGEARELIRLDRALKEYPHAFRMYASGRLGRRAAWLVTRVAHLGLNDTERQWVRFAMTHTLRVLEASVEAMERLWETDRKGWEESGNLPPEGVSFGEVLRACSFSNRSKRMVTIGLVMEPEEEATYEAALEALRSLYGTNRPEWYYMAVMAKHFLDVHADPDEGLRKTTARKVIERDNYTCTAPECLERGGLEAHHIRFRSHGGPGCLDNLTSLCAAHHRYIKHMVGSLSLRGAAPDDLTITMGERVYRKDRMISPAFDEKILDEEPWSRDARS